jgi:hypothetical protein
MTQQRCHNESSRHDLSRGHLPTKSTQTGKRASVVPNCKLTTGRRENLCLVLGTASAQGLVGVNVTPERSVSSANCHAEDLDAKCIEKTETTVLWSSRK